MKRLLVLGLGVGLGAAALASPAQAQLLVGDRLFSVPTKVQFGVGAVRLDGMGGFQTAVEDANNQINLNDFSRNPAGFGDDRSSWVLESRYGHREYLERDSRTNREDVKINEAVFLGGKYDPGNFGAGVEINYSESNATTFGPGLVNAQIAYPSTNGFNILAFDFKINKYLTKSITLGAEAIFSGEDATSGSSHFYNINHEGSLFRGGLGIGVVPVEGVVLGARGQLISDSIKGTSEDGFHNDAFTWDRPGNLVGLQGVVNRGRLKFGLDYTREDIEGSEAVRVSWSPRFISNPTPDPVTFETDTFSEDRVAERIKGRIILNVTTGITLSALAGQDKLKATFVANPNQTGSRDTEEVDSKSTSVAVGASFHMMRDRLLLAGEVESTSNELGTKNFYGELDNTLDTVTLRGGGEYFASEGVVARAGLIFDRDKFDLQANPDLDGSFNTISLAAGLGFLPSGGIWQVDLALETVLSTDIDHRGTDVGAYVKYLF